MATMETRNKKSKNQGVEAEEETEEISTSITMDQGQFATLMHSLQQSQAEIFARLIHEVRTSTPASEMSMTTPAANFSKCTARFNGSSVDVDGFIDAIEVYKNCLQISDDNAVKGLSMLLVDSAALWWQGIKSSTTSWPDAMQKLKCAFGEHRPPFRIYLELFSLRQNTDTTDLFIAKTRALLSRLPQEDLREKVQLDMVYGLLDRRIKKRLDRNSITSFDQLLHRARAIEESLVDSACDKTPALTHPSASHQTTVTGAPSNSASSDNKDTRSKRLSCNYCKKWGHEKSQCKKLINNNKSESNVNSDDSVNKNKAIQCYGCGTPNVIKSKCEKCKSSSQNAFCSVTTSDSVNSKVRGSRQRLITRDVGASCEPRSTAARAPPPALSPHSTCARDTGAMVARCLATVRERFDNVPRGRRSPSPLRIVPADTTGNPASCNAGRHLKLYCDRVTEPRNNNEYSSVSKNVCCDNNNRDTKFCVSSTKTCSHCSQHGYLIHPDDNDKVAISCCINKNRNVQSDCLCSCFSVDCVHQCVRLSSVNVVKNNGLQNCNQHLASAQGRTKGGPIKGEPNNNRPLMQIGILGENGTALLDTGARGCIAGHTLFRVFKEKGHPLQQCTRNIRLADGCTRLMEVLVAKVQVKLFHKIVPTEFIIFPEAQDNETLLGIDFINSAGLVINFKHHLWHFADSSSQKYKLISETFSPRRNAYAAMNVLRDDEGAGLEDQEREELARLLTDFQEVFDTIGEPTPYGEHHIDTGNNSPIATPPYRLTPAKKEIMQQELTKMLKEDIIEDCESAWAAPALLVPKRDGSFRFCVDYRKLNSITKSDAYPMPRIDELLQSTKRGRCHMSTIDLRSGYWQGSVKEEDRDMKTQLALLVGTDHPSWPKQLPIVRFSMNSAVCETTGVTPAYLTFARELRSPLEVYNDPRAVLRKDNFVPQITPYLTRFLNSLSEVRDRVEKLQDRRKTYADRSRRVGEDFKVGDKVLLATHQLSDASKSKTAKFFPKRDGPYVVEKKLSPTTYLIASDANPGEVLGKFHANQLTPFRGRVDECTQPLEPKKKRGRPRLQPIADDINVVLDHDRVRNRDLEGEDVARQPHDHKSNDDVGRTVSNIQSDDRGSMRKVGATVGDDQSRATIFPARPASSASVQPAPPAPLAPQSTLDTYATRRVSSRTRKVPAILDL